MKVQPLDLNELVRQTVDLTRPKWEMPRQANGAIIEVDIHTEATAWVSGGPAELREVLTNLIFNAVDAMPDGGTLTIRTWNSPQQGDKESGRQDDKVTGRQGDKVTGRQGDKARLSQTDKENESDTVSSCHLVTLSPCHPVTSSSPCLVFFSVEDTGIGISEEVRRAPVRAVLHDQGGARQRPGAERRLRHHLTPRRQDKRPLPGRSRLDIHRMPARAPPAKTRRQGDRETGRQGDRETGCGGLCSLSPCLLVSLSGTGGSGITGRLAHSGH